MRCARGQGTVEYLAVVLLVALVFGGTATAASGAGGEIAAAVPRELQRALCIVRRGDCYRDRAPCDVGTSASSSSWALSVAVFKIGHDRTVTVTRRSDGTFAVTLDTSPQGGAETTLGARARIRLGDRTLAAGADITAAITASLGHGRTWIADSESEARTLVAVLDADEDALPPADLEGHEGSLDLGATASAGALASISGDVGARLGGGWRRDRTTGKLTYFFSGGVSGGAKASAARAAEASISGSDQDRYALTVDRDGRWLDLAMTRTGALSGKADLPEDLVPIGEALDVPTAAARRWVTESHLDLTEARNLAAARALVARLSDPRDPRALGAALLAMSRRMREAAVVDGRSYAVDTDGSGVEGDAGLEVKVGGKFERSTETTRLLAARTRGIDGHWRERRDCMEARA